jgi:hypothetical protein
MGGRCKESNDGTVEVAVELEGEPPGWCAMLWM